MSNTVRRRYNWSGLGLVAFALLALTCAVTFFESGVVPMRRGEITATDDPWMYWTTIALLTGAGAWLGWTGVRIVLGLQQPYDWSRAREKKRPRP